MDTLRRYAGIYAVMFRNSIIREMSFKANFLLWMAVELLWFASQILFIEVIFGYVDRIGDWAKWEVVALVGTHQVISQLFQAFFYSNLTNIPELVRTGKMDFLLLLPVDSQFAASVKQFGLDNTVNALVGIGIITFAFQRMGYVPGVVEIGLFAAAVVLGMAIHYSIMLMLATVSFWIVRSQGLIYGYFSFFNIARYPEAIFRGVFRFVFTWIVPVIIVSNVPVQVLARMTASPWPPLLQLAAATLLVLALSRALWRLALRRYASASS